MGGGTWFLAGSRTSRDTVHSYIVVDEPHLGCRQQSQLYAGGKTSGIGQMHSLSGLTFMYLGQTVNKVMIAFDSEILCQIDNLHMGRNLMLFEKLLALAMSEAEEHDIHLIERQLRSELQVGVAKESFMHISNGIARITF
jgi:hypothetical protein